MPRCPGPTSCAGDCEISSLSSNLAKRAHQGQDLGDLAIADLFILVMARYPSGELLTLSLKPGTLIGIKEQASAGARLSPEPGRGGSHVSQHSYTHRWFTPGNNRGRRGLLRIAAQESLFLPLPSPSICFRSNPTNCRDARGIRSTRPQACNGNAYGFGAQGRGGRRRVPDRAGQQQRSLSGNYRPSDTKRC